MFLKGINDLREYFYEIIFLKKYLIINILVRERRRMVEVSENLRENFQHLAPAILTSQSRTRSSTLISTLTCLTSSCSAVLFP